MLVLDKARTNQIVLIQVEHLLDSAVKTLNKTLTLAVIRSSMNLLYILVSANLLQ
jgi:hypothetical protein